MASKSRSKNQQSKYASYKVEQRWAKNRRTKLEKLALVHPNNKQITEALKNISYRRKTPKTKVWSSEAKKFAQLVKSIEGKFNSKDLHKDRVVFTGKERVNTERLHKDSTPRGWFSIKAQMDAKAATR